MRCGMVLSGYNQWVRIPPTPPLLKAVKANDNSDGILTGREVVERCDFEGVELVALIGCGTGVGQRFFGGDSLASLRYSFTNAGGTAVLGSSWSVRVAETAQLMNLFFETQANHEAEADVVLQKIQKTYIENQRKAKSPAIHPYYWASFSVTR